MESIEAVAVHLNCERCGRFMVYEYRGHPRRLCDGCKQVVGVENQRRQAMRRRGLGLPATRLDGLAGVALRSQREVARILGVKPQRVQQIEREALNKLARHPGLKSFWKQWANREERPAVEVRCAGTQASPVLVSERLDDYEKQLREWRATASEWRTGGHRDADCFAEAAEVDEAATEFEHVLHGAMERARLRGTGPE